MIEGRVTANREAIVRLEVLAADSTKQTIDFVVDTGFTEFISLSENEIDALGLPEAGKSDFRFASGEVRPLTTYRAHVLWDGTLVPVIVTPLEQNHLLGMHLLGGATITIEATPGGSVAIECDKSSRST